MNKAEYFSKVQEVLTEVLKDKKYLKECRGYGITHKEENLLQELIENTIYYKLSNINEETENE